MAVSAHPDAILGLGTKDVLVDTRELPFGSDVRRIDSIDQLAGELPQRLRRGARVLKQHRGQSGAGVWRVELAEPASGFGEQSVNALHPAVPGPPAPQPGPRLYHPADLPRFQDLRRRLEGGWIELLRTCVGVPREQLPLLWDCDFMLGERAPGAEERYVLCEINVSSVSPFPPSAIEPLVRAVQRRLDAG